MIKSYRWSPSDNLSCTECPYPELQSKRDGVYTVTVTNENGCTASEQIVVRFLEEKFYIPNIVSTRSGISDNGVFYVRSNASVTYDMQIYNRWGGMVFEGRGLLTNESGQGWRPDETSPIGVYVYKVIIHTSTDDVLRVGDVTVL